MRANSICLLCSAFSLPILASCDLAASPAVSPEVKAIEEPPSAREAAPAAPDEFRPRKPAEASQEPIQSERGAPLADVSTPSAEFAFDGLYEMWIAEVAEDFNTAKEKYAGKRIRLRGSLRGFGHASRDGKVICELNLEAEPESETPDAVAARKYAPVGTTCTTKEPPWTHSKLGSQVTVVGVPFFYGSGSSGMTFLEEGAVEGAGAVIDYPRISATEIAEAALRDRDAAAKRYDGVMFIVTGDVVTNDRWTLTLRGAGSYTVQNNYGGASGPAFDDLKPGDRVELLGRLQIFDEYADIDGEVNYGYRP